ncbi:MAG: hypothetical protein IKE21_10270 [Erysipelotrichaceae bacterium]|nr:hypothetical protein [Erysipelotrichaceae bacterium]
MDGFTKEIEAIAETGIKGNVLRQAYEKEVRDLSSLPEKLAADGLSEEEIARQMHERRRELGRQYKEAAPPLFREYIYAAAAAKYGDPPGPTFEMLRQKKSCREIIVSASRPIRDLDDRLTIESFRAWYSKRKGNDPSTM